MWGQEARKVFETQCNEARSIDTRHLKEYAALHDELDRRLEIEELKVLSIAAVYRPSDRIKLKKKLQRERIQNDHLLYQQILERRAQLKEDVLARCEERSREVAGVFEDSMVLLKRLGSVLDQSNRKILNQQKIPLMAKIGQQGIDFGRLKSSDAANKLHRKITLNPIDRHPWISLSNGDLTMTHTDPPNELPRWGMVRATEVCWILKRYVSSRMRAWLKELRERVAVGTAAEIVQTLGTALTHFYPLPKSDQATSQNNAPAVNALLGRAGQTPAKPGRDGTGLGLGAGAAAVYLAALENQGDGQKFNSLSQIQDRLQELGFMANGENLLECLDDMALRRLAIRLADMIAERAGEQGRFYFEVHPHQCRHFSIGFSFEPLELYDFPGQDRKSFGFASDGRVWADGRPEAYTEPLSTCTILGVLIDLHQGNLTLFRDGRSCGIAFGTGSRVFSATKAKVQSQRIKSEPLIAAFALRGPPIPPPNPDASNNSNSATARPTPAPRSTSRLPATNSSPLATAATLVTPKPDVIRKTPRALSHLPTGSTMSSSLLAAPSAESPFAPMGSTGEEEERDVEPEPDQFVEPPRLSLNFGGYPFIYSVPGAVAADAYLFFATQTEVQEESLPAFDPVSAAVAAAKLKPPLTRSTSTLTKRVRIERVYDFIGSEDTSAGDASYSSWSMFPPLQYKKHWAVTTIARYWKGHAARQARQKMHIKLLKAVSMIQQWYRRRIRHIRARRMKAVMMIQRMFRGHRYRKAYLISRRFGIDPQSAIRAAVRIQQAVRRWLAAKHAQTLLIELKAQLQVKNIRVRRLQRMWRQKLADKPDWADKMRNAAAIKIQRVWRGYFARKELLRTDRFRARRMKSISQNLQRLIVAGKQTQARLRGLRLIQLAYGKRPPAPSSAPGSRPMSRRSSVAQGSAIDPSLLPHLQKVNQAFMQHRFRQRISQKYVGDKAEGLKLFFTALDFYCRS
eukprot:TRINITY_DN5410_c0_g2_i5.p1 TRINITY_DN5410_c0_g2~~TRINITY_DN5410_c0_g2_i5.p1  ORF type:complete len:1063 (-),score=243.04 TRINITY_DN5410_c0_g2_i5:59-2959(-)